MASLRFRPKCGARGCDATEEVLRESARNGRGKWGFPDPKQIHLPVDKRQRICRQCAEHSVKVARMHWQRKPHITLSPSIKTAQHDTEESMRYWGLDPGAPELLWILEELRHYGLPPGWIQHITSEGVFFFNKDSRITTRDFPGKRAIERIVPILLAKRHQVAVLIEKLRELNAAFEKDKLLWQGPFVGVGNCSSYYNIETGETRLDDVLEQISFEQKIVSGFIQRHTTMSDAKAQAIQMAQSAIVLQRRWRTWQARLHAERFTASKLIHHFMLPLANNGLQAAAIRIQRNFRGRRARRKYLLKRSQQKAVEYDHKHHVRQWSNTSMAASVIQRAWRTFALSKARVRSVSVITAYRTWESQGFTDSTAHGQQTRNTVAFQLPESEWHRKSAAHLNAMQISQKRKQMSVRSIVEKLCVRTPVSAVVHEGLHEEKQPEMCCASRARKKPTVVDRNKTTQLEDDNVPMQTTSQNSLPDAAVVFDEDSSESGCLDDTKDDDLQIEGLSPSNAQRTVSSSENDASSSSSSESNSSCSEPRRAASPPPREPAEPATDVDAVEEAKHRQFSGSVLGRGSFSVLGTSESSDDYHIPPYSSITQFERSVGSSFLSNLPASARVVMPIGEKLCPIPPVDRKMLIKKKFGRESHSPNARRKRQPRTRLLSPLPVELKFSKRYYA